MERFAPEDRLIVALDVPTAAEALDLARQLDDTVSTFKVGWQLFMAGEWRRVVESLEGKTFFVDLKLPDDIDNTIASVVQVCLDLGCVRFLTLSEQVKPTTVRAARRARGIHDWPRLLVVPLHSSIGQAEFDEIHGRGSDMDAFMLRRTAAMLGAGCDGVIASGPQIEPIRAAHPEAIVVSPGIRPAGASTDDHSRFTLPGDAIRMGADCLVVGRPITRASDPRAAARRILDEVAEALADLAP